MLHMSQQPEPVPEGLARRVRRRAQRELDLAQKRAYRFRYPLPRDARKAIVVVAGCQRSGTTLLLDIFNADRRSVTFPERSALSSSAEERLRLKPVPEMKRILEGTRAALLVLKPLVESQNLPTLLEGLDNCHAVWMYRRPESVAASDLSYFGMPNGERNLRLLLTNEPPNWRGELVPDTTRSVLSRHYRPGMNPYDAAALFWWARNSLFFDLRLDERPEVNLCSYERLISSPEPIMRGLYDSVGVGYPHRDITHGVHQRSVERGNNIPLDQEVRELCEELWQRLQRVDAAPPSGA